MSQKLLILAYVEYGRLQRKYYEITLFYICYVKLKNNKYKFVFTTGAILYLIKTAVIGKLKVCYFGTFKFIRITIVCNAFFVIKSLIFW